MYDFGSPGCNGYMNDFCESRLFPPSLDERLLIPQRLAVGCCVSSISAELALL